MDKCGKLFLGLLLSCAGVNGLAQEVDAVSGATMQHIDTTTTNRVVGALSRLHLGGYGEAVMTRNFLSGMHSYA